jgi:hypothetical protein
MSATTVPSPALRRDLNLGNTWLLPEWSTGPVGDERAVLEAASAAGYQGVQGANPELCRELGLVPVTFDIRIEPGGLAEQAARWADQGFACATLMVGTGFESDAEADRLADEIVEASAAARIPLYLETHRATMTQDMWRTLQLVQRHPDLRFNGDFSHWYTGQDMAASDVHAKLDRLAPVIDRVRYVHGRIASPGCVQVDVGDGRSDDAPVSHFREMWTRVFRCFLSGAAADPVPAPGLEIGFAPELLPGEFGYARYVPGPDGSLREESDRWEQALVLTRIAAECFDSASGAPA